MKFVTPKVYWVGFQEIHEEGLREYLRDSGNEDFLESVEAGRRDLLSSAEILCSFFAKLCYKSLSLGQNENVSRIREIKDNITGCHDVGHGSVFEHVSFNFVAVDCSRVFTHELVRHRVGTAYSQNSGRYIRLDEIDMVFDPILEPIREHARLKVEYDERWYKEAVSLLGLDEEKSFARKKKLTSALRRFAPNGQSNEIGFSINLRSIRHMVMMRTSRHAEWEFRLVFEQVYTLLKDKFPTMFHGANEEVVEGIIEVTGMKLQPHEKSEVEVLKSLSNEVLEEELLRRKEELEKS